MRIEIALKNDIAQIEQLAEQVLAFGRENDLPDELAWELRLVLEEVVTNIISYGYDDQADHVIKVSIINAEQAVTLTVQDDARPFNLLEHPLPDLEIPLEDRPVGGLGIHMVRRIMDDVDYRRDGGQNRVVMCRYKQVREKFPETGKGCSAAERVCNRSIHKEGI